MTWNDISVFQYQQIVKTLEGKINEDTNSKLIAIVNYWTLNQVEDLSIQRYNNELLKLSFINEDIGGKPINYIYTNGNKYECLYDIRQFNSARYIETKVFGKDVVENMHKIFASMVVPMKKTMFGWKRDEYDASKHEDYANDLLMAKITEVYPSVVFFYHLYRNWMEVTKDYLIQELESKGIVEAKKVVAGLLKSMDGSIAPSLLPTSKIAKLQKLTNSQLLNTSMPYLI